MDATAYESAITTELLDALTSALTHDSLEHLADLKASAEMQSRVSELAEKCNRGELSDRERVEYEAFVRVGNLINMLKAKARKALAEAA